MATSDIQRELDNPYWSSLMTRHAHFAIPAREIDAWLKERARAAADHDTLARMSDRELLDIGLDRCAMKFVVDDAWVRDCPY